jgi:hypothetical protein
VEGDITHSTVVSTFLPVRCLPVLPRDSLLGTLTWKSSINHVVVLRIKVEAEIPLTKSVNRMDEIRDVQVIVSPHVHFHTPRSTRRHSRRLTPSVSTPCSTASTRCSVYNSIKLGRETHQESLDRGGEYEDRNENKETHLSVSIVADGISQGKSRVVLEHVVHQLGFSEVDRGFRFLSEHRAMGHIGSLDWNASDQLPSATYIDLADSQLASTPLPNCNDPSSSTLAVPRIPARLQSIPRSQSASQPALASPGSTPRLIPAPGAPVTAGRSTLEFINALYDAARQSRYFDGGGGWNSLLVDVGDRAFERLVYDIHVC